MAKYVENLDRTRQSIVGSTDQQSIKLRELIDMGQTFRQFEPDGRMDKQRLCLNYQ